ncbi:MAG: sortase [Oscillospiraceae bacterium]|nr:sortase [Oscillospiraceae bacterium]
MNNEPQDPMNNEEQNNGFNKSNETRTSRKNNKGKNSFIIKFAIIGCSIIALAVISFFVYRYVSYQNYISNRIAQAEEAKTKISDTLKTMDGLQLSENQTQVRPDPEKIMLEDYPVIGRINIPSISIDYPIITLTDEQNKETNIDLKYKRPLELAIVKYDGVDANQVGNLVLMGHDYRDQSMFGKLKNVKMGDTFTITDMYGATYTYKVDDIFDAHRSDDIPKVVDQNTNGKAVVTMFTCTNDPIMRLCVRGTKVD